MGVGLSLAAQVKSELRDFSHNRRQSSQPFSQMAEAKGKSAEAKGTVLPRRPGLWHTVRSNLSFRAADS